jgi:peroxiredoxin Q/BCP
MTRNAWIFAAICVVFAVVFVVKTWASDGEPLAVGTAAPGFTLASQSGEPVSLSEFKGRWVVLYFYPKDKTTGCTIEAHNFQRDLAKYEAANAAVVGVSLDTAESHASFCTQEGLHFKLLADPEHKVVDAYRVPVKNAVAFKFASRWTYLIDPQGKIAKVWTKVDVQTHSDEVLAAIAAGR